MQDKQEKKTYWWLLLIIIIAAAAAFYFYHKEADRNKKTKVPSSPDLVLNVMPARAEKITVDNSYIGYVTPINSVAVTPYISGFLEDIMVSGGQEVEQGDTLVVIQQDEYKANLNMAQAKLLQSRADYANAAVYYKRMREAGTKIISKTELDNAKAQYLMSRAAVAEAQASVALAKVNYDYTVIQAPISGIVGDVSLSRGDYVSPSSPPLFTIIQYDPIRVVFSLTDKEYLDEITRNPQQPFTNEKITLRLANGKTYDQNGQYKYMGNELDKPTSSISVYADFANPSRELVANAYVDVLVEKTYDDVVRVRQSYVILENKGSYVYTVRNGGLNKKAVEIVTVSGNDYLLKNTFAPEEYIVIDKVGRIAPGQKIKTRLPEPPAEEKK